MEEEFLLEALRWMMKSRLYDNRVIALQRNDAARVVRPAVDQLIRAYIPGDAAPSRTPPGRPVPLHA